MVADGVDTVEYVRNNLRLNRAGSIVKDWDLNVLRQQGLNHIITLLEHEGYRLGRAPVPLSRVVSELRHFARKAKKDKSGWSEDQLHLWCTSQMDPEILTKIFQSNSASPDVISSGIDSAKAKGKMRLVRDQRISPAPGREYHYVPQNGQEER
jgi:hypothetical protein